MKRRAFLAASAAAVAAAAPAPDQVRSIETAEPFAGGTRRPWFHPRACLVPGKSPRVLMTMQEITGSDVFHHVHWTESRDGGRSWSEPRPIPGMGRRERPDGYEEGVCDVVPEYHERTGTVLAIGHNVYYRGGRLARPAEQRWPVYTVLGRTGEWQAPRRIEWSGPDASGIYTCGCSQRVTLPGGELLIAFSFGPASRTDRAVSTARCLFDGREVRIEKLGPELRLAVGRGLLEPSLARSGDRFLMTIRAEDGRGYVTRSHDGLKWEPIRPWQWDSGEPLDMSTTQQHWLPAPGGMYLVYTRKAESNQKVMRWRTPLWMARVDVETLRLLRATERIVFPQRGDGGAKGLDAWLSGNFHTCSIGPRESMVTDGQVNPARAYASEVLLARVRWK